jgi:NADPH:quinone reductase-like Zn-dependent oxidoreductase
MTDLHELDIKGGTGNADALFISSDIDKPKPVKGQALVKIKAFGLNRMDLLQREGHYPVPPQGGKILGVEFSGTVEELGSEVQEHHFSVGDEVFGLACLLNPPPRSAYLLTKILRWWGLCRIYCRLN